MLKAIKNPVNLPVFVAVKLWWFIVNISNSDCNINLRTRQGVPTYDIHIVFWELSLAWRSQIKLRTVLWFYRVPQSKSANWFMSYDRIQETQRLLLEIYVQIYRQTSRLKTTAGIQHLFKCIIYSQTNQNKWKFKPPRDSMINPRVQPKGLSLN